MKQHYLVLDSFRGICACIVAMSHFNANSIIYGLPLFDRGSPYVDFFFVLSGFVIFANYQQRLQSGYSIKNFMFLRLGRLYPLHFAVLLGFISVDLLQFIIPMGGKEFFAPFSAPGEDIGSIIAMFFLVHSLHMTNTLALNGPSWSISVELFTYLLFALILVYTGKYYRIVIAVLAISSAILLYILCGELYSKLSFGFLRCIYGFSCGAFTWMVFNKLHENSSILLSKFKLTTSIEILIFIVAIIFISVSGADIWSFLAPLIFSIMVFTFAHEGGFISSFLKKKIFLLLGTLSYSIYMTHMFISGKFFDLPIKLLKSRMGLDIYTDIDGKLIYGTNLIYGTLLEIFYLVVVVACSYISYRIIEVPFRDLSRKIVRNKAINK